MTVQFDAFLAFLLLIFANNAQNLSLKYIRRNFTESLHIGASIYSKMCQNRDFDPMLGEFIKCV